MILSIFKEDNVFSMTVNLPYDPPVNTNIDYYKNFFPFVSVAIEVVHTGICYEKRSQCLPYKSEHQAW